MRPKILLRSASAVALLQSIAHTVMLLTYKPRNGAEEAAVVEAMKSHLFNFGGLAPHSYWQLYIGYGLFSAINCLIEAVLFWQLAAISEDGRLDIRPIATLFCVANIGYAIMVWKYFFVPPLVADIVIATCLGWAALSLRPRPAQPAFRRSAA